MPATRIEILEATIALLRSGRSVSLDAVASEVGLTKAGLIHHFRSKQDLMLGMVDHVATRWVDQLRATFGDPEQLSATRRIEGYARLTLERRHDEADIAMLADPRLRSAMTRRWVERLRPWVQLDDVAPGETRATLIAVRLIADGIWFNDAADMFPVEPTDRPGLQALLDTLLERCHRP